MKRIFTIHHLPFTILLFCSVAVFGQDHAPLPPLPVEATTEMSSNANVRTMLCSLGKRTERRCSSRREPSPERAAPTHLLEPPIKHRSLNNNP